jgi:opacity protein-like surface antigen
MHRLSVMGAFTSNSFLSDYLGGGIEYGFRNTVMLRAGYRYELDRGETTTTSGGDDVRGTSFYTGFSAGATVQTRISRTGPGVGINYSYRPTQRPANGVHAFSLQFNLK